MTHGNARSTAPAQQKRALNGVLLLDKPLGITSQTAVLKAKHLLAAAKAGHTGTLDPLAGGLLPICFGEATKFSHLLLDADKTYMASVKLGVTTSTGDMEGKVTATAAVAVERYAVEAVLVRFTGEILQTPPMYSAVKHAGKPLYKYARAGQKLARAPRRVGILAIELAALRDDELSIKVTCGKGTYIRVLAEDIGRELGCGACLAALTRTAVGRFKIDDAVTLEALSDMALDKRETRLLPVDSLVATLPRVDLDSWQAQRITTGLAVEGPSTESTGLVRIYGPGQRYLGIATAGISGTIVPRRLMATGTDAEGNFRSGIGGG